MAPGTKRPPEPEEDEDEAAACATRSHTWREGWERVAVDDLALRTRPEVMFAKPPPTAEGTRSGNWRRC